MLQLLSDWQEEESVKSTCACIPPAYLPASQLRNPVECHLHNQHHPTYHPTFHGVLAFSHTRSRILEHANIYTHAFGTRMLSLYVYAPCHVLHWRAPVHLDTCLIDHSPTQSPTRSPACSLAHAPTCLLTFTGVQAQARKLPPRSLRCTPTRCTRSSTKCRPRTAAPAQCQAQSFLRCLLRPECQRPPKCRPCPRCSRLFLRRWLRSDGVALNPPGG